jgi:type IV pili sensor histidine kinase/response regulator
MCPKTCFQLQTIYLLLLCPLLNSCGFSTGEPIDIFADQSTQSYEQPSGDAKSLDHYIRTDRYRISDAEPDTGQVEPLLGYISVNFGEHIKTIGDAMFELLRGSGYRVLYEDKHACTLGEQLLFSREFPLALRALGPVTLKDALQTVAGKAWEIRVSELKRTLSFHARDEYLGDKDRSSISHNRTMPVLADRDANERIVIEFNPGEFHALAREGMEILQRAVRRMQSLPATALVRGHAHSSGHWATQSQALRRAKTVRDLLIAHGVSASHIRLDTSVSNNNDPLLRKLSGVELLLFESTTPEKPLAGSSMLNCDTVSVTLHDEAGVSSTGPIFTVQAGSLRKNVERLLRELNMRMGKWDLADGDYEYDWEIPHSYTIEVSTPDQAMHSMLSSYGIQPVLNLLDNSMDFVMHHKPVRGRP